MGPTSDRSRMIRVPGDRPGGFSADPGWAREVLVRHKSRVDPDWLLASVLRSVQLGYNMSIPFPNKNRNQANCNLCFSSGIFSPISGT